VHYSPVQHILLPVKKKKVMCYSHNYYY
jgi:hypothetical protein